MSDVTKIESAINSAMSARKDLEDALSLIRADIAALEEKRATALALSMSADEIKARVAAHLDSLEAAALERLIPSAFSSPEGRPDADRLFRIAGVGGMYQTIDGVGALCALGFRSVLEKELCKHALDAAGGGGPSASERAAGLARIESELEAAELAEEALIREAEEAGIAILRRPSAKPEVYLRREVA